MKVLLTDTNHERIKNGLESLGLICDEDYASSKEETEKAAFENEKITAYTEGKTIVKIIVVPGKLVNIVVR